MSNDQASIDVQQIRAKIEDYVTTIHALQAFISLTTWDENNSLTIEGTHSCFGRRMDTSSQNRISPETTITPDAVIQRSETLGYIVEVKKTLPVNNDYWDSVCEQLLKYDDSLIGWWTNTETIPLPCVVLLIEISRAAAFSAYLQVKIDSGEYIFNNPTSIVEFTKSSNLKENIFIRKHWGEIHDEFISSKLSLGKKVPIEKVVGTYGRKKFYDAEPIVEHTMVLLWQDIFTECKSDLPYDDQASAWVFNVNLTDLTDNLRKNSGSPGGLSREITYPRMDWVRKAMDALVSLGYADKASGTNEYIVYFRRIKGDVLERFSQHRNLGRRDHASSTPHQTSFFNDVPED